MKKHLKIKEKSLKLTTLGFTLIELLAVIIILAVIALIATPIILNVVENARKKAFQSSANGYYDAARYLYDELYLNNDKQDLIFTFDDGVQNSSNEKYQLKVNGEKPKGGMVYLAENGEILVSIQNGKYCATTDGTGKVNLSKDIENCGYTPEECFTYSDFTLTSNVKTNIIEANQEFEGMDETLLQIDSFDSENPSCRGIIFIPEEHEGRKVEGIKANTFGSTKGKGITSVVLPKQLKVIGDKAFYNASNLKQVVMNEELRAIGMGAFQNTKSLKEITLPVKLSSIDKGAFISSGIQKVNFLSKSLKTPTTLSPSQSPFTRNTVEELYIGPEVTEIPRAFMYKGFIGTDLVIPNNVTTIGNFAFEHNILKNVTLGNGIINIESRAFNNNQLPDDQAFIYQRNDDGTEDKTTIIGYGGAKRDNVIIPDGVTTIEDSAFYGNQLTSVTIPSSVTTIGTNAFSGNQFENVDAITIEGDATRFDSIWTSIGFPAK